MKPIQLTFKAGNQVRESARAAGRFAASRKYLLIKLNHMATPERKRCFDGEVSPVFYCPEFNRCPLNF